MTGLQPRSYYRLLALNRLVPEARALATKMAGAWAAFARTGNPSQPGLQWTPSDPANVQTMVFDNECRMVNDPEGDVRRILTS